MAGIVAPTIATDASSFKRKPGLMAWLVLLPLLVWLILFVVVILAIVSMSNRDRTA